MLRGHPWGHPMPVQQARARSRQQRILRAAADVIARRGFREAAVDEIAREAQTSKGGVYFHFPGKEAILLALLDHTAGLLRGKVDVAMAAQDDPVAKAEAALHELLRVMAKHRTLARVFALEASAAGPKVQAKVTQIEDEFSDLIRDQFDIAVAQGAIEPIDTSVAAQAWMGVLNAVILRWASGRDRASLESKYEPLRTLLLRSIGAQPTATHPTAAAASTGA